MTKPVEALNAKLAPGIVTPVSDPPPDTLMPSVTIIQPGLKASDQSVTFFAMLEPTTRSIAGLPLLSLGPTQPAST
jgi:hypothetical protein